jgi:YesN/AraC family two-component response regulator
MVREGLVTILALQNDLNAVGRARDGEEAYWLDDQLCPDILILDLRMPSPGDLQKSQRTGSPLHEGRNASAPLYRSP